MAGWVLSLVIFVAAGSAWAKPAKAPIPRVGILPSSGDAASYVRREIEKELAKRRYKAVSSQDLVRTARKLKVPLDKPGAIAQVATALDLRAAIGIKTTTLKGGTRKATIVVRDGGTGEALDEGVWTSKRGRRALALLVRKGLWRKLGPAIAKARTGAAPAPSTPSAASTAVSSTTAPKTPADPLSPQKAEPAAPLEEASDVIALDEKAPTFPSRSPSRYLEVRVGPRFLSRSLSYDNDPNHALIDYETGALAPAIGLAVAWFPFARGLWDPGRNLGLALDAELGAPLKTTTDQGLTYRSPNHDAHAALVYRWPSRFVTVDAAFGGGWHRFSFDPQGDALTRPRFVPGVNYRYLRGGAEARFAPGGPVDLFAGLFYRHVLRAGTIVSRDWFPASTVWGLESTVGAAYRWRPGWEARLSGELRRYRFSLNAPPGSGRDTEGAVDSYLTGWLAVATIFDGQ